MRRGEIHWQTVAALSLLDPEGEQALLPYLQAAAQPLLQQALQAVLALSPEKKSEPIEQHLKALRAGEDFSGIAEIHPAWLAEILRKESSRVVGVMLRYLPSRQVRYLLEHLPMRLRMNLPQLVEAFYVPRELLDLLRRRIESHFKPMHLSRQLLAFRLDQLYYLKIEELQLLLRDLGLSTLSLALVRSPRKILQIVLNRFMIPDAKEVLKRIKTSQGEEPWLLQEARYSILELGKREAGVERFLNELGLNTLARAFVALDPEAVEGLKLKLEPSAAALFKRFLDEKKETVSEIRAGYQQDWVLRHVERLSGEGKIDPLWAELANGQSGRAQAAA